MTNAELRQELRNAIAARNTGQCRRLALRLAARHTRTTTRSRTRTRRSVLPPIRVAAGTIPGPPTVHVGPELYDAFRQLHHDDEVERAAYAYGRVESRNTIHLDLLDAYIVDGSYSRVDVPPHVRAAAVELARARRCDLAGVVHSHPRGADPSDADLDNWRTQADDLGHPFVGIILAPHELGRERWDTDGWCNPRISAWVAQPGGDRAPVIEARVRIDFGLEAA